MIYIKEDTVLQKRLEIQNHLLDLNYRLHRDFDFLKNLIFTTKNGIEITLSHHLVVHQGTNDEFKSLITCGTYYKDRKHKDFSDTVKYIGQDKIIPSSVYKRNYITVPDMVNPDESRIFYRWEYKGYNFFIAFGSYGPCFLDVATNLWRVVDRLRLRFSGKEVTGRKRL